MGKDTIDAMSVGRDVQHDRQSERDAVGRGDAVGQNVDDSHLCKICGQPSEPVCGVHGRYTGTEYHMRRCPSCRFTFIADPWLDFGRIYDERYYEGRGADPTVDYRYELERPDRTIRVYEWAGVSQMVHELMGRLEGLRWLDFGCGNGGLVRYLNSHANVQAHGFDEGAIVAAARRKQIPILSLEQLREHEGSFDVVSAIEVIEHAHEPLAMLRQIRRLLRPGGLLLLTTGNARPFAEKLAQWSYVMPEVHISFFEPGTLEVAMRSAGFRPERRTRGPAFDSILKTKVLQELRVRRRNPLLDMLPASLIGAVADHMRHLSEQPVGWAQ